MKILPSFVLAGWCLCLGSCRQVPKVAPPPLADESAANFTLLIANESHHRPVVDVAVEIDGRTVIRDDFDNGPRELADPPHATFLFVLPPGEHALRIRSEDGGALREERFSIQDERDRVWASTAYWYSPGGKAGAEVAPSFSWTLRREPILLR